MFLKTRIPFHLQNINLSVKEWCNYHSTTAPTPNNTFSDLSIFQFLFAVYHIIIFCLRFARTGLNPLFSSSQDKTKI